MYLHLVYLLPCCCSAVSKVASRLHLPPLRISHGLFIAYRIKFKHLSLILKVSVQTESSHLSWRRLLLSSPYWNLSAPKSPANVISSMEHFLIRIILIIVLVAYAAMVLNLGQSYHACTLDWFHSMIICIHVSCTLELKDSCSSQNIYQMFSINKVCLLRVILAAVPGLPKY
jgi:hypothetical protein